MSYKEYLYKLLQQQVITRVDDSVNRKIKNARFPFIETLEEFNLSFQLQGLISAEVAKRLSQFLGSLSRIDLFIIDGLCYLQLSKRSVVLFIRLAAKRYEKGLIVITSNKPFLRTDYFGRGIVRKKKLIIQI